MEKIKGESPPLLPCERAIATSYREEKLGAARDNRNFLDRPARECRCNSGG